MSKSAVSLKDCSPEIQKILLEASGEKKPRSNFPMELVRQNSIKVLGVVSGLTLAQRDSVLKHAIKMNQI